MEVQYSCKKILIEKEHCECWIRTNHILTNLFNSWLPSDILNILKLNQKPL